MEEETKDYSFGEQFQDQKGAKRIAAKNTYVQQNDDLDVYETPQDLQSEFGNDNLDQCTIYITDSPDIISRGRNTNSVKNVSKIFKLGAPIAKSKQSTQFNRPNINARRKLTFEEDESTSPAAKETNSINEYYQSSEILSQNDLRYDHNNLSGGSMSFSSTCKKMLTSESTSMESGFISDFEDSFFEVKKSNSSKDNNSNDLMSGTIKNSKGHINKFKYLMNLTKSFNSSPKAKVSLISISESPEKRHKRAKDSSEGGPNKRKKFNHDRLKRIQRPVYQKAFSENHMSIMSAMAKSDMDPDLIGDFSGSFTLPLTSGDHTDLKSISCDTLAALLRGEYEHVVHPFQVIDCRYPYEFEGGHILGAINLFTQEQVLSLFSKPLQFRQPQANRTILVFHCEFSVERGPNLCRYLRSSDRAQNLENYPFLHYPEMYLLHEGYRGLYQKYPELCVPIGYTAMLDPKYRHLMRKHRSTSQSSKTRIKKQRHVLV